MQNAERLCQLVALQWSICVGAKGQRTVRFIGLGARAVGTSV